MTTDQDKPVITYTGRSIVATLAWARGLMSARAKVKRAKGKRKLTDAQWHVTHAWTNLAYWATKPEKKDER